EGSSRLIVLFGWFRLVCTNGLVIRETVEELCDLHDEHLMIEPIPELVLRGLQRAGMDRRMLKEWEATPLSDARLKPWVDGVLRRAWGPKAACRVFHICRSGHDVEVLGSLRGDPSAMPVTRIRAVPGSPAPAQTLFDLSQALSWVATLRAGADERVEWQRRIPDL